MANVLLVMGHRNLGDQGNPEERRRTIFVVEAAKRELRRAGHTVHVLQKEDDDGDDTTTHRDLAFVANRCTELIRRHDIQVMIDAHFQGSPQSHSGCFCIFPDGNGLNPTPPGDDSKAANQLDVKFAAKLAEEVSRQTTIPRLRISEPGFLGGMSETQTGVASPPGRFRLGMFGLTFPVREQCVRVVMEHGDITADSAVIDSPGFYDRVATAYVRAINTFWPIAPLSTEFFAFGEPREFTAHAGAVGRKHASTDSEMVRQYQGGDAIRCIGYYESQEIAGDNRWLRSAGPNAPRIHCSGVVERVPAGTRTAEPSELAPANGAGPLSAEERLARAEVARRGPRPESAAVMETAVLGCSAITSVAEAVIAGS